MPLASPQRPSLLIPTRRGIKTKRFLPDQDGFDGRLNGKRRSRSTPSAGVFRREIEFWLTLSIYCAQAPELSGGGALGPTFSYKNMPKEWATERGHG